MNYAFLGLKLTLKYYKIEPTVYSKPTDNSHLHLQADSCHHLPSILRIQKGIAERFYAEFSTDEEYSNKSKGYKAYLIGTGHILKNVEKPFDDVLNVTTAIIKKQKTLTVKTALLFVTSIILWDRM